MQWLAALCVRRPVFATVLVLSITVVGVFGYTQLGVDRFPKVDFPTILITTRQPGASPQQIETEISDKIEEAVNTISGLDELRSNSAEGVSIVAATFVLEKDVDIAAQEVRDKVNRVLPQLPRNVLQPVIEKLDTDAAPVLGIAVSAPRPVREVTEYADKVLRRRLETVNGVGQVLMLGGRRRQINLWLDASRLRAYNVTVTDVARALQSQNVEVPGGRLEQGPVTLSLRTRGRVQSVEEFGDLIVRMRDGHPILVRDVATVEDGMAEPETLANVGGAPAVVLNIRRQSGTNAVEVIRGVKARLEELRPTFPPGYEIRIVRDQGAFIEASIRAVQEHLVLGAVLAALVVLLFLNNLRSTIIAAIAIPTSIVASFGLIWYMDFTLNAMTMLALTLSVGIVIDDAIVVLENIYRFIEEKGRPPALAAVEATREIGLAVTATTFSLVAIFLPVGFMGGIPGRFLKSFGFTMAFAILVSLLVSFTLTPMLGARWLRLRRETNGEHRARHSSRDSAFFHPLDVGYTRLLRWALTHRAAVAGIAVAVLLSSLPLFMAANKNFLPSDDQSELEIGMRAPEGTSLQATVLMANRIATSVGTRIPEAAFAVVTVGDDSARTPNLATVYVRLKPIEERTRGVFEVMDDIRTGLLPEFAPAGLRTAVRPIAAMSGGGQSSAEIQFVINGPDIATLQQYSQAVAAATRAVPGAVDVDTSLNPGKPEVQVELDRAKTADLGVLVSDAADALRLLVGGDQVTTYNEGDEQYEVHLRALPAFRRTEADVGGLTVPSARLGSVPLVDIATYRRGAAPAEIQRLNRERQVTLYANLLPGTSQVTVMGAMEGAAAALGMGPEYRTRFAGRSRELGRTAQAFVLAFLLSLVFMYLILAAQFESWLHPITILLSLPLTLPFALVSIIVTGQSLNIFSALGLLVLFGVVKKNAILQIDRANQLREQGMERHQAVVQASRDRLRPILMTTMSFVAGMIPLVVSGGDGSGTNRAIGFVIIGGQTLVLVLTLVVTPVAYSLFDDVARTRVGGRLAAWFARVIGRGLARVRPAGAAGIVLALLTIPAAASAQVVAARGHAQAELGGPTLRLTLDEAVRLGLENNPDIQIDRIEPALADQRVAQADGAFTPQLSTVFSANSALAPPTSFLVGSQGVSSQVSSGMVGVSQRLPWYGSSYAVGFDASRTSTTSLFANFNPTVTARLQLAWSQPLLRDLRIDASRQQVTVSKRNREISDARFRETVVRTLADVKKAYWDLVAARAVVDVQHRSLDLARDLVRINRARVEAGQSPPLDLVAARAEEAQREEALAVARIGARQAEDRTRLLILDPEGASFWTTIIETVDRPDVEAIVPEVDAVMEKALSDRLDLVRARRELDNARTNVVFYRNQTLPDLRVQLNLQSSGLGGTRLIREGSFPGTVVGSTAVPFGTVLEQVIRREYPAWTISLSLSYPVGRAAEEAALARARLEEQQARARLASLEVRVVRQIRQAAWQIEMSAGRVATSRAARALAEERLNAEQKRFDVGMSTSFLVVQAQRDLAQARNNELSAALDYVRAVVDFEAVQQAPLTSASAGSSMTVTTGSSPAAIGGTTAVLQPVSSSSSAGGRPGGQ
ncbi:MAG: efflux RND transporter permease subunit [Acidobacteriota bacterium]